MRHKGGNNAALSVGEDKIQRKHRERKKAISPLQPRKQLNHKIRTY